MKRYSLLFLILLGMLSTSMPVLAESPVYTGFFSNAAVGSYDTVAYFIEGKPVKGDKRYMLEYKGVDWYFSSKENLQAFSDQPEKYAPQYGGYCAWAVGHGLTAKGNPLQWTIYDDKLYLNIDRNIQDQWLQNKEHWIKAADENWPAVLD